MHLTFLDFAAIVGYLAALSLMGMYFSKRQKSRKEYFLGDRDMHWMLVGGSILATFFSTISYLSLPGEAVRYGLPIFAGYIVLPLVIPVTNRIIIPVLTRLPITSAYEYLEMRFHRKMRWLASAVFVTQTLLWSGIVIYTASLAFVEMTGWGMLTTILVVGIVTTFYTSMGGFRMVIWGDNFQLWVLFGGVILIATVIALKLGSGPLTWWAIFSEAGHTEVQTFSWDPTVRVTLVGNMISIFFWYICKNSSDQMAVQRFLSMPSMKEARRSTWVVVIGNAIVLVTLFVCGMALFVYFLGVSGESLPAFQDQLQGREADRLMPRFIAEQLPMGVSGLLLAAILAAAMSSLSSGINSVSSVVMTEWLRFSGRPDHGPAAGLKRDRVVAVSVGIIGIAMAVIIMISVRESDWNLVELSTRINHILVAPMGVVFFVGLLFRRAGAQSALLGFLLSFLAALLMAFGGEWFHMERSVSFTLILPLAFLLGFIAAGLSSLALPPPSQKQLKGLTLAGLEPESSGPSHSDRRRGN